MEGAGTLEFEGIKFSRVIGIKTMGMTVDFYACLLCGSTVLWTSEPQGDVLLKLHAKSHGRKD